LRDIFSNPDSLADEVIEKGLNHRNFAVRRVCTTLLRSRGALKVDAAERLLADDDAEVKFQALLRISEIGEKKFSHADAKRILVNPRRGLGLLAGGYDSIGQRNLERFEDQRMRDLPLSQLQKIVAAEGDWNRNARFALIDRTFRTSAAELRAMLDDRFQSDFDQIVERMIASGASPELVAKTRSFSEHLRTENARMGLNIICKHNDPRDLNRVRSLIGDDFVRLSIGDLAYLKRNGEWSDVLLIIEKLKKQAFDLMFMGTDETRYRAAAEAIYHLGRDRLEELFVLAMPYQLMAQLIGLAADARFKSLSDETILKVLRAASQHVRKIAALKCVRIFSRERLIRILNAYMSDDDQYYYNVIHWLDFGLSAPRERATASARRELQRLLHVPG